MEEYSLNEFVATINSANTLEDLIRLFHDLVRKTLVKTEWISVFFERALHFIVDLETGRGMWLLLGQYEGFFSSEHSVHVWGKMISLAQTEAELWEMFELLKTGGFGIRNRNLYDILFKRADDLKVPID